MTEAIHYTCACGAEIRLPSAAAGKRARCKTCGAVFAVPLATAPAREAPTTEDAGPGKAIKRKTGWLRRLYEGVPPDVENEAEESAGADNGPLALLASEEFWSDFGASFIVPFRGAGLITVAGLVVAHFMTAWLPTWYGFSRIGYGLFGVKCMLGGYLAAFYLTTLLDTASGRDTLPVLSVGTDWEDFVRLFLQVLGTGIYVFLPAFAVMLTYDIQAAGRMGIVQFLRDVFGLHIPNDPLVRTLVVAGVAAWPSVILMTTVGGTLSCLWPHLVLRTMLAAPLAYLAVATICLLPCGLLFLESSDFGAAVLGGIPGPMIRGAHWLPLLLLPYCILVAMRAIGLYYRHFKQFLPWAAE